jgi:hypothetical protein
MDGSRSAATALGSFPVVAGRAASPELLLWLAGGGEQNSPAHGSQLAAQLRMRESGSGRGAATAVYVGRPFIGRG